jgi:protocatechuate 3,4-dioxygenase, beta subunit
VHRNKRPARVSLWVPARLEQCYRSTATRIVGLTSIETESKMAIYSIDQLSRREIIRMSAALASSAIVWSTGSAAGATTLQRTPGQILGPFYPLKKMPQTADLTRVPGRNGRAAGQVLNVMGRVLNLAGDPVRDATVEVWQANAYGRYTHPSDTNPAPLDPNFDRRCNRTVGADVNQRSNPALPLRGDGARYHKPLNAR